METKAGAGVESAKVPGTTSSVPAGPGASGISLPEAPGIAGPTCPSVLDLAAFEAGDLDGLGRAELTAHARHCVRCGTALAELQQARREILGTTDLARLSRVRLAAREIEDALRRRLH